MAAYLAHPKILAWRPYDFQFRMRQKPFVGWALCRPAAEAHSSPPDLAEFGEETSRGKEWIKKEGRKK